MKHGVELKDIEAFLMVVEHESFSSAADALFITQPTISVRIRQLEEQLQTTLFTRENGKKIRLTQAGKAVYPYFLQAFQFIQQGLEVLVETSVTMEKVNVSCPNHMGVEIMPEILKVLYDEFPNCEFPLKVSTNEVLVEEIRQGRVDIGFSYQLPSTLDEDISVVRVANEENILVCAPDHALAKMKSVSFSDLGSERIIVYNQESLTIKMISQELKKFNLNEYRQVEISNVGWMKMMVRKRLGIAFLQRIIVEEELHDGKLVQITLKKRLPPTPIYLISRNSVDDRIKETVIHAAKEVLSSCVASNGNHCE